MVRSADARPEAYHWHRAGRSRSSMPTMLRAGGTRGHRSRFTLIAPFPRSFFEPITTGEGGLFLDEFRKTAATTKNRSTRVLLLGGRKVEELPNATRKRMLELQGSPLTEAQREEALDAYRRNPGAFERALAGAERVAYAAPYFISAFRRINREEKAATAAVPGRRHDLDEPTCRMCGDSGFVILTRDLGPEALTGDAAPCICDLGVAKQKQYGTVHYGLGDYEPTVPDQSVQTLWFQEYAQTEAGKEDPHRTSYARFINKPKEMP